MKMLRLTPVLTAVLCLCGCASTMQVYPLPKDLNTIDEGKARIRVHRPQVFGSALAIEVRDNGDAVGKVGPLGTITWDRQAGVATISGYEPFNRKSYGPFKLTTEPGKQYNLNVSVSLSSGLFTLQSVSDLSVPSINAAEYTHAVIPQQSKPQTSIPTITPRRSPIQASLVIVHDPSCTTVSSNWIYRVRDALEHRNLFTTIEVLFEKPNLKRVGFGTNDTKNAFTLFIYNGERDAEDASFIVNSAWIKDAGSFDRNSCLMLWPPSKPLLCGSPQDLVNWVERIELVASQQSVQDAVSLMAVLEKPVVNDKKLYVFQSFDGWSLCKDSASAFADVEYCVVGVGRPFTADGEWFQKPLYWCGTFTYETRGGASPTVARYASSLDLAVRQMRSQIYPDKKKQPEETVAGTPSSTSAAPSVSAFQTGFCISSNGHVVTCAHGIENATNISVRIRDWEQARVVAVDKRNDIAILKIDAQTTPIPIQGAMPHQGDDIAVWGFPNPELQGENLKSTKGSINSLTGIQDDIRLLQFDAAVQPGNSGSPVVSADGTAVGMVISRLDDIVTLALTETLPQNVNYAIKSAYFMPVIQSAGIELPSSVHPFDGNAASRSVFIIRILAQPKEKVTQ